MSGMTPESGASIQSWNCELGTRSTQTDYGPLQVGGHGREHRRQDGPPATLATHHDCDLLARRAGASPGERPSRSETERRGAGLQHLYRSHLEPLPSPDHSLQLSSDLSSCLRKSRHACSHGSMGRVAVERRAASTRWEALLGRKLRTACPCHLVDIGHHG